MAAGSKRTNGCTSAAATAHTEPVLSLVDGEWPLFIPPSNFAGVHQAAKRSLKTLVAKTSFSWVRNAPSYLPGSWTTK